MSTKKILFSLLLAIFVQFLVGKSSVFAQGNNSFITIVNPVRISSYTNNPAASLNAEYNQVLKREIPATWLLTYDAISNESIQKIINTMDKKQELGIFLEVTDNFAKNSKVTYNKTSSWHHANSLFLSGYKQDDRRKLIDKVFSEFKKIFGYYPKSVGGWWVDSFSLSYMKNKYGIIGVLGVSDQFDLDNYQVWGTPYSVPFYPSKINAGVPGDVSNKLDIVTFRWAARDPLNGYISPSGKQASLYSVQDYPQVGLSDDYFEKLVRSYSNQNIYNKFGQVTIGLEADYSPDIYKSIFAKRLDMIGNLQKEGFQIQTMANFSDWYRHLFPKVSPSQFIETDDLISTKKKIMWYQSVFYRAGLLYDYSSQELAIIDLHKYFNNFQEPFYISPNGNYNLSINLPYLVDLINDKDSVITAKVGYFKSIQKDQDIVKIIFEKGSVAFSPQDIKSDIISVPQIKDRKFEVSPSGLLVNASLIRIPFAIKYRLEKYRVLIILFSILAILLLTRLVKSKKLSVIILVIICFSASIYFILRINSKYYISQTEIDGLNVLRHFSKGKVLAYDKDCLRCVFETPLKPAASQGIKDYIQKISGKNLLVDFSFEIAKTSAEARKILRENNINYIYLVRYEKYIEALPYLPQDLGLSKAYENANVEIWKVN